MTRFPAPIPGPLGVGSPRDNPGLADAYNSVARYVESLEDLGLGTDVFDVYWESSSVYSARRGAHGDTIATGSDIGALINSLWATGGPGTTVRLLTQSVTWNCVTPIVPPSDSLGLIGFGPTTQIVAQTSANWTTGTAPNPGNFMFDAYNAGAGRKWLVVKGITFDCNNIAEGGMRNCGLASDTTQWNYFAENFVMNFRRLGWACEDQSVSGGTRQYIFFNKIGPGTTGQPTRGMDLRCNDVHLWKNDIFRVSDVGLLVAPRGGAQDKSVGTWWWDEGHIHTTTYVAGGLSPDTQPVNVLITSSTASGHIHGMYVDNIKRHGIYFKPNAGNKQSSVQVSDCWFNGGNLVDSESCAVVFDAANVKSGEIYNMKVVNNRGNSSYSKSKLTAGRWKGIVSLRNGLTAGNNSVEVDHNGFRGCLAVWDPLGARPDAVGEFNYIQPANNQTSQGKFSGSRGRWTTLQNLLSNPSLLTDANADLLPDGWTRSASSLTPTYPGNGTWQGVYPLSAQLLYQDTPVIAGVAYSAQATEQVTSGSDSARITLAFYDETGTICITGGGPFNATSATGIQGPTAISTNNRTAPADDGTFMGTVDTASGTAAIVAKTGTFPNDLVNPITLFGAGAAGADLVTTIVTFTNTTHVTLAVAPSTTLIDGIWRVNGHGDAVTGRISLKASGSNNITIQWQDARLVAGADAVGQSGANTSWTIAHNLPSTPLFVSLTPANAAAAGAGVYVSAVDATNITVVTSSVTAPAFYWKAGL